MIITIETDVLGTENSLYSIHAELKNGIVFIKNEYKDFVNNEKSRETTVALDKKELHDFIGALLHLQSKLNQKK